LKNTIMVTAIMVLIGAVMMSSCYGQDVGSDNDLTTDENLRVFEGKVTNVDVGAGLLTVSGEAEIVFPISSSTKIQRNSFNEVGDISLSDIKNGDYVNVSYYRSGTDSRVTNSVIKVTVQ